ncbi:MAG: enhanced serine sensitivity protein SseB [Clostridiales bacterium]|nr:enhanced serine sensitivity protein SseB [Clostridiales bacterium]
MDRPDVNKPVENPKLRSLLEQFNNAKQSNASAQTLQQLTESIAEELAMNSHLLAVITIKKEDLDDQGNGKATFKKNSPITFAMSKAADGTLILPVYTDWESLRAGECYQGADVSTLIMSFDDMAAVCAGKCALIINMFTDKFVIIPQNVVNMKRHKDVLTQGVSREVIQKDTEVMLGEPADYPQAMVDAICKYAKRSKSISRIWLKLMYKNNERSFLLTVDFKGDMNTVFKGIADSASSSIPMGMFLDMVPFSSDLGRKAATGDPFYVRKKGLFG